MVSQSSIDTPTKLKLPGSTPGAFLLALDPKQQYLLFPNTVLLAPLTNLFFFLAMFAMAIHRALASLLIFKASFLGNKMKLGSISLSWYINP
jgi:hypothetical protein